MNRFRKALVSLLGLAATLAVVIPVDSLAGKIIACVLAAGTIFGVYQTPNAQPVETAARNTGDLATEPAATGWGTPADLAKSPPADLDLGQ